MDASLSTQQEESLTIWREEEAGAPLRAVRRSVGRWDARLCALVFAVLVADGTRAAATTDLRPLLNAAGTTVTLSSSTVYTINEYAITVNKTLLCNGATIQSTGGPMRASGAGVQFIVDNCVIQGSGWALLGALSSSNLIVRNNTSLTGNGSNSAIYVNSATLDLSGSSISGCMWGVNMVNGDADVSATSIASTIFGIQNVAGTATVHNGCQLQNTNASNPGTGVSLIGSTTYPTRAASALIMDTTFTGFQNAVDILPTAAQGLPSATVEIVGCRFDDPFVSALSANDAVDVRFAESQVNRAKADGIYMSNSSGVIEDSEILGSLNTGVTFFGCQNGGTLRNSLVSDSVHQGVAIGADTANGRVSRNIQILDNTLKNNTIANVYVDNLSEALVEGNIMSGAPDYSMRLHGSPGVDVIGDLLLDSSRGLEMRDGDATIALSFFTGHDHDGALVYNSAAASFAHCAHQDNLRNALSTEYSVFVNTGGLATLRRCSLGPAGSRALYNNAGNTTTATKNFWAHSTGPKPPGGGASGALIGWNTGNGSALNYQPFLASTPLDSSVNRSFNIAANTTTTWAPFSDLSLSLRGDAGIASATRVVGALRVRDTSTVATPAPLGGTMSDGILAVWAEYDLLARAESGSLRLRTVGSGSSAGLYRLQPDGTWLRLVTTWSPGTSEVVYNASDPRTLNGVFALVDLPSNRETLARQLITNFYNDVLARAPEAGAVDAWYNGYFLYAVNFSIDVRFVPQEMGRLFFLSAEYASRNRTNAEFIRDCYQAFLHRQPSQSELDTWLSSSTWNRPQVITLFAQSAEFATYIQGLFPNLNGIPTRNLVTTMYIGLLDRIVDSAGLAYFAGLFEWAYAMNGIEGARGEARSLGRIALASGEYQSKNPTNRTHVERLYRAYLGRFPATNELDYWRGELDAGRQTTNSLIDAFAASSEFTQRLNAAFGLL